MDRFGKHSTDRVEKKAPGRVSARHVTPNEPWRREETRSGNYLRACARGARDDSRSSLPRESAKTSGARCSLPRAAEAAPTLNPTWRSPRCALRRSTSDARAIRRQSAGLCPLVREIFIPPMGEDAVRLDCNCELVDAGSLVRVSRPTSKSHPTQRASTYLGDVSSSARNANFSETSEDSDGAHLARERLPRIRLSHT